MDTRDLLVKPSAFPAGWEISRDLYSIPKMALVEDYHAEEGYERVLVPQGFEQPGGPWAMHQVLRYHNEWEATVAFYLDWPGAFYAYFSDATSRWEEPEDWAYRSPVADRFRFACQHFYDKDQGQGMRCSALAQYEEFISVFEVNILLGTMSLGDIERILRSIDEQMASHLGK